MIDAKRQAQIKGAVRLIIDATFVVRSDGKLATVPLRQVVRAIKQEAQAYYDELAENASVPGIG